MDGSTTPLDTGTPGRALDGLPGPIAGLGTLALNLRWSWDPETARLFREIDPGLWASTRENPVELLRAVPETRLRALAADAAFVERIEGAVRELERYLAPAETWRDRSPRRAPYGPVAYFSAEFGIAPCLRIYSGGLGVLSGDHLKSASDLGIPLVGVGILYREGYLEQRVDGAGRQEEIFQRASPEDLPLERAVTPEGEPARVAVPSAGGPVEAAVWRARVGRVPLLLLDTAVPENGPRGREIGARLYAGGPETRIRQEILLGIGGHRALRAVGISPGTWHMNEGHSAFLALERIRERLEDGAPPDAAVAAAREELVFTSHTPVPAGHDRFAPELVESHLGAYREELGLDRKRFLGLGRVDPGDDEEPFCMTVLALRSARRSNGVSRRHGEVTRQMWSGIWPRRDREALPIGHVTNGVHLPTWIAPELAELYEAHGIRRWRGAPGEAEEWARARRIPDEALWAAHRELRRALVEFARERHRARVAREGAGPDAVEEAGGALDPDALTIGFARRFAPYKRATLILRDPERLAGILADPDRPVQLLFAGKAHPRNEEGKELLRGILHLAERPPFRGRIVFLENYDLAVARRLVRGCDLWLNTPRPPREASGTSGMKAAANGVLNLSTPDGWWPEGLERVPGGAPAPGWTLGPGAGGDDPDARDRREAGLLLDLLVEEVVPEFHDRDDGLPRRWIERMKSAVATVPAFFESHRMLAEYDREYYRSGDAAG